MVPDPQADVTDEPDEPGEAAEPREGPRGRVTRRSALKVGLCGAAGLAGAGAVASYFLGPDAPAWTTAPSAEVFKGDAPTGDVWEGWLARGWAREARHYRKVGRTVRCRLCPNNCKLSPGDRGRCRSRVNKDGKLYTLVYGNPCSWHLDPIEKKPLYHFLPTTWIFSIATTGCGFRCLNCQNWEISQAKADLVKDPRGPEVRATPERIRQLTRQDADRLSMFPADVVAIAEHYRKQPFYTKHPEFRCESIAYTYSEPTVFYEYMIDTARLARRKGIKNVWVTCGYIHNEPLAEFCEVLDAANVDLKGFRPETYRKLNSGKLEPILNTLKTLKERGVWFEITNLVVPTYTDDTETIRRMCGWLVDNLGPDYPIHFSRFHPQHKLTHLPPTPSETLVRARAVAREAGLRYVYVGNVVVDGGGTTYCPNCKRPVIERYGYAMRAMDVVDGKCRFCKTPIAGVWTM